MSCLPTSVTPVRRSNNVKRPHALSLRHFGPLTPPSQAVTLFSCSLCTTPPPTSAIPAATYRISHGVCRSRGAAGSPFAWIVGEMLIERAALRNHGGYIVPRAPLLRVSPHSRQKKRRFIIPLWSLCCRRHDGWRFCARSDEKGEEEGKKKKTF